MALQSRRVCYATTCRLQQYGIPYQPKHSYSANANSETYVQLYDTNAPLFLESQPGGLLAEECTECKISHTNNYKNKCNAHTEPLFRELSLLKANHIFQLQCLKHNKRNNTCISLKYVRTE